MLRFMWVWAALLVACSDSSSTPPDAAGPADAGAGDAAVDTGVPDTGEIADTGGGDTGTVDAGGEDTGIDPDCDPSFSLIDACGGDPIGSWDYVDGCTDDTALEEIFQFCPGVGVISEQHSVSGTLEIDANGYTRSYTDQVTAELSLNQACAMMAGSCASLGSAIEFQLPGLSIDCVDDGVTCICDAERTFTQIDRGTYQIDFEELTTTSTSGEVRGYHFCANQRLVYRGTAGNPAEDRTVYVLMAR